LILHIHELRGFVRGASSNSPPMVHLWVGAVFIKLAQEGNRRAF